jgi:membrane-associated protease RseP (regulator of RpoE activity)
MGGGLTILLFVVAILLVILVHEAGHFFTAKAFKIKVEEFFLGFGPRLWSIRRGETEYGVKALPLGGYVRIAGMNPYVEPTPEEYPRTFGAKPIRQRAMVIVAGPATHFVIAFLAFALWFGLVGPARFSPVISDVSRTLSGGPSPAAQAGLRPGDEILAIDGIEHPSDQELVEYTRTHVGRPVTLTVKRYDLVFQVTVTPVLATVEGEQVGRLGVTVASGDFLGRDGRGPFGAIGAGLAMLWEQVLQILASLGRLFGPEGIGRVFSLLFGGAERQITDPTSIVGAARFAGQAAEAGNVGDLLFIFGSINVFVGILNLLPLPPFDGGHLAVLAVEKIRGRKVDMRKLIPITAVVATFLIIYMGSLLLVDIFNPLPNPFE